MPGFPGILLSTMWVKNKLSLIKISEKLMFFKIDPK
jgi:hypothetical protein